MTDHAIDVVWYGDPMGEKFRGWWDQGMLEDLLSNRIWRTGYSFIHHEGSADIGGLRGAVVVIPARLWVGGENRLTADLCHLEWAVLMVCGDEESSFAVEAVTHPNMAVWVMSPRPGRHDAYGKLGTGYPPHLEANLPSRAPNKDLDLFFAGQITHDRRQQLADVIETTADSDGRWVFIGTEGFTQGLPPHEYAAYLAAAKVAPAPSGPRTPDTFRLFEALQAGCVPIADTRVEDGSFPDDYWTWFFDGDEPPFPTLRYYCDLEHYVHETLADYPTANNRVGAWWAKQKYRFAHRFAEQVRVLSGIQPAVEKVTVLIPTSPIPSHPDTAIIEQTVRDVRVHQPDCDILILLDVPHEAETELAAAYAEYQRRLIWLCAHEWRNVLPVRFEEFLHQSGKVTAALPMVTTPMVLFVEHDAPLTPDRPICWDALYEAIETGAANVIRFSHETHVLEPHEYLYLGDVEDVCGAPMRRTCQWSGRPHLASTAWYRQTMAQYFGPDSRAFIEHGLYGPFVELVSRDGLMGWNAGLRLWMFHPEGNILRSYTLNGRGEGDGIRYESVL